MNLFFRWGNINVSRMMLLDESERYLDLAFNREKR
jgi:hypothetical protein